MADYTRQQAHEIAKRIKKALGPVLTSACANTLVSPEFLAGLIGVENPRLLPNASRFESHVYNQLKQVQTGMLARYGRVTKADLANLNEDGLKNLATSWGLTQIMGYHSIALHCEVRDLRDDHKHIPLAIKLLDQTAGSFLSMGRHDAVLRIWNTGKANGTTHDPHYVENATLVQQEYELLDVQQEVAEKEAAGEAEEAEEIEVMPKNTTAPATPSAGKAKPGVKTSSFLVTAVTGAAGLLTAGLAAKGWLTIPGSAEYVQGILTTGGMALTGWVVGKYVTGRTQVDKAKAQAIGQGGPQVNVTQENRD